MKLRAAILILFAMLFANVCNGQTTSTITGTIRDVTGQVIPSGQVTFDLKPGADTTISGSARFTPQTVVCTIHQASSVGSGATITSLARAANVVTATFSAQTDYVVGSVLSLGSWSDATFNGTSAFTVTAVSGIA